MKPLLDRIRDRCRIDEATGCWHWQQGRGADGYPVIGINALNRAPLYVHRLVYVLAVGVLHKKRRVFRTCENRDCVCPQHLLALTERQAAAREQRKESIKRGVLVRRCTSKTVGHKLTLAQAREIRAHLAGGHVTQTELARRYGVDKTMISRIARNVSWREATPFSGLVAMRR